MAGFGERRRFSWGEILLSELHVNFDDTERAPAAQYNLADYYSRKLNTLDVRLN